MARTEFASVKLPAQLVDQAREAAGVFSRSLSGQLEHWAKLGRALESAPGFTIDRARAAIEGRFDPADLAPQERPYYYEFLDDDLANPSEAEVAAMAALGSSAGAAGYNDDGQLVRVGADRNVAVVEE